MADPDPEIRGGGGGGGGGHELKNIFPPSRLHFGLKIRGNPGSPGPSPVTDTGREMSNLTLIELISIWGTLYYDPQKKNKTRIVNYEIDSFAFMSTLKSHRLGALGKVTAGFSAQSRHFSVGWDQTTNWYSSRLNRTKLGSNSVYSSADQMTITQAGKGEYNRKTVKQAYCYLHTILLQPLKTKEYNRNVDRNRLQLNENYW